MNRYNITFKQEYFAVYKTNDCEPHQLVVNLDSQCHRYKFFRIFQLHSKIQNYIFSVVLK